MAPIMAHLPSLPHPNPVSSSAGASHASPKTAVCAPNQTLLGALPRFDPCIPPYFVARRQNDRWRPTSALTPFSWTCNPAHTPNQCCLARLESHRLCKWRCRVMVHVRAGPEKPGFTAAPSLLCHPPCLLLPHGPACCALLLLAVAAPRHPVLPLLQLLALLLSAAGPCGRRWLLHHAALPAVRLPAARLPPAAASAAPALAPPAAQTAALLRTRLAAPRRSGPPRCGRQF